MKINLELNDEQIDDILAKKLETAYDSILGDLNYGTPEEYMAIISSLNVVYNYYTGKHLK